MDNIRYLVQYNPLTDDVKDYTIINIDSEKERVDRIFEKMRQNDSYGEYLIMTLDTSGKTATLEELKKRCRYHIFKNLAPKDDVYASIMRSVVRGKAYES
jgi:hypothetical protein